jgi:FkbM family methyltransferase
MKSRPGFTLIEVLALVILVVLATLAIVARLFAGAVVARPAPGESIDVARGEQTMFLFRSRQELAPLQKRYGPGHYSRYVEEWVARDFFHDRRRGVFLDVGAGHYRNESNTYFLETELEWSGVAVDALPEYADGFLTHRPRTKFIPMFASDVDGSSITLFEPRLQKRITSYSEAFTARKGELGTSRTVPTATLNRLLEEAELPRIDYLSMDIELAEPKALAGFDIKKYRPDLVCIEVHPEVRQQVFDYFARNGYVMVGKYLRIDPTNVYFQPLR